MASGQRTAASGYATVAHLATRRSSRLLGVRVLGLPRSTRRAASRPTRTVVIIIICDANGPVGRGCQPRTDGSQEEGLWAHYPEAVRAELRTEVVSVRLAPATPIEAPRRRRPPGGTITVGADEALVKTRSKSPTPARGMGLWL